MRSTLIAIFMALLIASPCFAEKSFDEIEEEIIGKYIELPNTQDDFFKKQSAATVLVLGVRNIDSISPQIGQLRNLQTLSLFGSTGNTREGRQEITIPPELLNLPRLRTLILDGISDVRLSPGTKASQIQSHIERLRISGWTENTIPFLADLTQLRELSLKMGNGSGGPIGLERLHNLRALWVEENAKPLALEQVCGLANLERLFLFTQLKYPLPKCLERLTRLKAVAMFSCRRESLPDKTKIYFPVILTSLPSLEGLSLFDEGAAIEIPKTSYGLKNLRTLVVTRTPSDQMYEKCPAEGIDSSNRDAIYDFLDLDAVVDYPKLERIILQTSGTLKGSTLPGPGPHAKDMSNLDIDPIRGIRRFLGIVDAAWKQGKLLSLKQIDMAEPSVGGEGEDGDGKLTTVWKRPSSQDESGIMIPKNMRWMLKKERDKASSRK